MKSRIDTLEKQLSSSTFRRGTSAFRYGAIPSGPSDHLPIYVQFSLPGSTEALSALSWNLLSDDHLYNNFLNITGTVPLLNALNQQTTAKNIYGGSAQRNRLYHFFSELALFLYEQRRGNYLPIDKSALEAFIASSKSSHLSKDEMTLQASRKALIELLTDDSHPDSHEFRLAIQHSLELFHHIQDGALRWENRLPQILENKALCQQIQQQDLLSFQECSNPQDMLKILGPERAKTMQLIKHSTKPKSKDNCVLLFDTTKFSLDGEPVVGALQNKKPYIFVKLVDKATNQPFIAASIHHPGGAHDHIEELKSICGQLQARPGQPYIDMPFILMGDFNHPTGEFTAKHPDCRFVFPTHLGTLAGSDFGNMGQAIDAAMTNLSQVSAKTMPLPQVPLADNKLIVDFKTTGAVSRPVLHARPNYAQPVSTKYDSTQAEPEAPALVVRTNPLKARIKL